MQEKSNLLNLNKIKSILFENYNIIRQKCAINFIAKSEQLPFKIRGSDVKNINL